MRRAEMATSYLLSSEPVIRLGLPGADPPFVLAIDRHGRKESPFSGSIVGAAGLPHELVGVSIVQISVEFEYDLAASDFDEERPVDRALAAFDQAYAAARASYQLFRSAARLTGQQYWIGMAHDEPQFAGLQTLEDLDAGAPIPVGYPRIETVAVGFSLQHREQMPTVAIVVDAMATSEETTIAATLLADARAIYWPRNRTGHDHQRAVLLAAIATEIGVKHRLRQIAPAELASLLDLVIANPRDVTQSVPQLLHKTCEAICGRSLLRDDRPLYDAVEKEIVKIRNDIVHRGRTPTGDEGRAAVEAAVRLFAWLDALPDA